MTALFRSLRARLVLLLLLVMVPAAVMVAVTHGQQRQFVATEMEKTVRRITGLVLDKEDAIIGGAQALVVAIANSGYVAEGDTRRCRVRMEKLVREQSVYLNLGYVDEGGNLACSAIPASETLNFADRQWFRDARDSGAFTTGEYVLSRITGEPVITYAYPITDADGRFSGVAYAVTTLAWLAHMVTTAELPPQSTAAVVDVQGNVLARYPDPDGLTGRRMPRTEVIALLDKRPDAQVVTGTGHDGLQRIYSLAPLKVANRDVYLLIGLPLEAVYGSIDRALRTNLVWLALLAGLAIAGVWIGVDRLLAGRIRRLADAAARLAAGELSTRSAEQHGVQELDQLARAFDQMAERLEKREAEREAAERALRESESRYRQLIELSPDAVFVQSEERFAFLNSGALRLFGAELQEQLLGRPVLEYFHPDGRATIAERFRSLRDRMGTLPPSEERILRLDGKVIDVEVAAALFRFDGKPAAQVVARDITERKRAQAVLRESEERFRALVETSPDAISIQVGGRIEFTNDAFVKLLGAQSRSDLVGRQVRELIHPEFHELSDRRGVELYQNRKSVPPEILTLQRLDRTTVEVEGIATPITIGGKAAVMSVMRDITERRTAERALRESQAQLRGIIDSAMDAIITIDEDQCVVLFNPAAEVMFQCPVDEAVGALIERFIPARYRDGHSEHVRTFGEAQVTNRRMGALGRVYGLRADGSEFPVEASISRVAVLGHRYYTVIMRDITERERAEAELRRNEASLANAQKLAKLGSWELDLQTNRLYWSKQIFEIFGIEESAFGASYEAFLERVHPADRPAFERAQQAALAGDARLDVEHRILLPDGAIKVVHELGNLVHDAEGNPVQLLGTVLDITERKAAQDRINQLNASLEQRVIERTAQLEAANQELQAFSYSVSHDLRAPLRGIDGWSLALLEDCGAQLDDRGREYLDRVRSETQRMGRLIDDLLGLSRVTQTDMRTGSVDLSAIALELVAELKERDPARQVDCLVAPGIMVQGDAGLLRAALTNLLENAWKFTGRRELARIEFGRIEQNSEPVCFVRDNGVGFDPAYARKLFAPFQRMHKASEFPGTGIGLATVSRIVARHGGRIWAEAAVDRGATFYFTLPTAGASRE